MTPIRLLSEATINRIAAGEVIERPAAAVKELVENALDAGARRIAVALGHGGIDRIEVTDDGAGMTADGLALAVLRHCTSKLGPSELGDESLVHIATLGFRGEALPSIGAAARLAITSRPHDADHAATIAVEGSQVGEVTPAAGPPGTRVVVRDLFFATPARRKFLKHPRTEADHAEAAVRRLALAAPHVAFRLELDGRVAFDLAAQDRPARVAALLGAEAAAALLPIDAERGLYRLSGFACSPAISRATGAAQGLTVNGRPVADPVLKSAVRVAYRQVIAAGRFPVVALYLDLPPEDLDVNVHPAKTELRFRDTAAVRSLVIGGIGRALAGGAGAGVPATGLMPGGVMPGGLMHYARPGWSGPDQFLRDGPDPGAAYRADLPAGDPHRGADEPAPHPPGERGEANHPVDYQPADHRPGEYEPAEHGRSLYRSGENMPGQDGAEDYRPARYQPGEGRPALHLRYSRPVQRGGIRALPLPGFAPAALQFAEQQLPLQGGPAARMLPAVAPRPEHPMGAAVAQVLDTYVLAVAADGSLVVVDQHAAHERLMHEMIRDQMLAGGVRSQPLLLPAVVDLPASDAERLLARSEDLLRLGLEIESFGPGAVLVRALPAALGSPEPAPLLRDLADELAEFDDTTALAARLDAVIARLACHGSIRAGRRLSQAEMDALLRQMEATPRAATCSHGRPTFLKLSKAEIETLFGRR